MFTSPLELSAFLRRFQDDALRPLAAPILGCTRLLNHPGNTLMQLFSYCSIKVQGYEIKVCKTAQNRGIHQETNCTLRLPYIALRDEASRAGRYLEGTCALAIRACNR